MIDDKNKCAILADLWQGFSSEVGCTDRMSATQKLRDIVLKTEYRSDTDDLISDFYVPCLQASTLYQRAVGYFTSQGLAAAAQGITALISGDGRMMLVASPVFDSSDLEAIQKGYYAREDIATRALLREVGSVADALTRDRLGYLAWLISSERLDIRIAIPSGEGGQCTSGIYHEKIGLFKDKDGNVVAFTGSPNETSGGLVSNFESMDVFWSWDDPHGRVPRKIANFERLWKNETTGLDIVAFPDAVKERLLRFRPEHAPRLEVRRISAPAPKTSFPTDFWPHQVEAVQAWEHAGRTGLISMATGSGKTRTALVAADRVENLQLLVIAVPRNALVYQWASELERQRGFSRPILVHESSNAWQDTLFNRLRSVTSTDRSGPIVVIGTMHSLSGERFDAVLEDSPPFDRTLLIVDEVHNAGAPTFQRTLRPFFLWRLGLSATPARHFDEEGTSALTSFFGDTVYVYDLRRALKDGHLCPYRYFVYPAELSDREYEEYEILTKQIARFRHGNPSDLTYQCDNVIDGDSQEVRTLLFRRARILKRCEAKLVALDEALLKHRSSRCLIYCADNEQLRAVQDILDRRKILHLIYTAQTPSSKRQETLSALGRGDMSVVLAIDCLDEGVDVPTVDQAIIVASSSNKRQFVQRRGRILRRAPGKAMATLVDIIAIPPSSAGSGARKMLNGELARAKEMAELADNKHEALQNLQAVTSQFGVTLAGLLSGESNG